MSGRFSIRRVASPQLAPEQPVPAPEMADGSWRFAGRKSRHSRANALHSEKVLDAKVRLHRRLIEEINLSAMEKLPPEEMHERNPSARRQIRAGGTAGDQRAANSRSLSPKFSTR